MAETPVPASKNLMLAFLGQRLLALQIQQTKQQAASPRSVAELSGLQNAIEEAQYANFVTLNGGPLQRTLGVMRIGVAPLDMTPNRITLADGGPLTLAPQSQSQPIALETETGFIDTEGGLPISTEAASAGPGACPDGGVPPLAAPTFPPPVTPPVPLATVPLSFPPEPPAGVELAPEDEPGYLEGDDGQHLFSEG